jgi:hypothetical protein
MLKSHLVLKETQGLTNTWTGSPDYLRGHTTGFLLDDSPVKSNKLKLEKEVLSPHSPDSPL